MSGRDAVPSQNAQTLTFSRGFFEPFLTHRDGLYLLGDRAPAAHLSTRDVHAEERAFLLVPDGRLPNPVALAGNALDLNGRHACGENDSALHMSVESKRV